MKKFLGILVLGLLLISCDQSQDQKKSKKTPDFERALENCSDYNFEYYRKAEQERWEKELEYEVLDKKKVKELVNYWKNFKKMPLSKKKTSKKRDAYMTFFNNCQLWWKENPKKFKEKWL